MHAFAPTTKRKLQAKRLPPSGRPKKQVKTPPHPPMDPKQAASAVALKYVSDESPGIRRKKVGTGFTYVDAHGKAVRDEQTLRRIKALVIPPAWTEVWICPEANGHLQATGFDARGRN